MKHLQTDIRCVPAECLKYYVLDLPLFKPDFQQEVRIINNLYLIQKYSKLISKRAKRCRK